MRIAVIWVKQSKAYLPSRKDPLLVVAKAKSRKDFERDAIVFIITWTKDVVTLNIADKSSKFQFNPRGQRIFTLETSLDTIVESILKTLIVPAV
jgi:hypothetical protein